MQLTKLCSKCNIIKSSSEFGIRNKDKSYLRPYCKICTAALRMVDYYKDPDKSKAASIKWKKGNIDKVKEYSYNYWRTLSQDSKDAHYLHTKQWASKNRPKCNIANSKYKKRNPDKNCYHTAKRRSSKLKATVDYGELNTLIIEEAYKLAQLRNNCTNIKWHVDHVIPLKGKYVCGLHVGINLQVIPAIDNMRKGNRI